MKNYIQVAAILVGALAVIGSSGVLAGGTGPDPNIRTVVHEATQGPEHRRYLPIRILRRKLVPSTLHIRAGEAPIWSNHTEHLVQVLFPVETAKKLVCKEPSNFLIEEDELRSTYLRGNEFASVCIFTKGTYDYEVAMIDIGPSGSERRRLKGTLVIE